MIEAATIARSVLSTSSVPEPDRLAFWHEVVCRTIAGIEAKALVDERPYAGSIRTQSIPLAHLPNFDLIEVEADPQLVTRTPQLIDRGECAWLLMIQEEGICEIAQGGRQTTLEPGDIGLLDTSRPYQVMFPQSFRQSILRMPELLFRDIAPRGNDLAGFALPGRQALTAIARQNLLSFERCADMIEPAFLPAAANCAIDHLSLAMRATLRDDGARRAIVPDHVVRADAWIMRNLHDAIRDRRLANCRKELADPSLREQSITEIAFRWGFSESSSFSRAFRRAFGVSPRQFRRERRP